jgi:hypothetical protein
VLEPPPLAAPPGGKRRGVFARLRGVR